MAVYSINSYLNSNDFRYTKRKNKSKTIKRHNFAIESKKYNLKMYCCGIVPSIGETPHLLLSHGFFQYTVTILFDRHSFAIVLLLLYSIFMEVKLLDYFFKFYSNIQTQADKFSLFIVFLFFFHHKDVD